MEKAWCCWTLAQGKYFLVGRFVWKAICGILRGYLVWLRLFALARVGPF